MTTLKCVYSLAKIFLLTAFCLALSPITAKSQVCGDMNGDGNADILDWQYLINYLYRGGPPPPDLSVADVDGFKKITLADWCYIEGEYGAGYPPSTCTVLYPPIQPIPDSTLLLSHTQWLDSGVTNAIISLELSTDKYAEAFSLVFILKVGDDTVTVDSSRSCWPNDLFLNCNRIFTDSVYQDMVVLRFITGHNANYPLYTYDLYVTVNPSTQRRPVSIEFTYASPIQASPPDSSLITMFVEQVGYGDTVLASWEPVIICCLNTRGDLNGDGDAGNIIDLTHLVDFIFRGRGDAGNCPDEADINNDGASANILDLTTIVDFIFRGGSLTSCYE